MALETFNLVPARARVVGTELEGAPSHLKIGQDLSSLGLVVVEQR